MNRPLKISVGWELLNEGSAEEHSCFAAVGIQANNIWLTEGRDALANRLRQAPLLSAYHLAEWFAWNWWRLRWEPRAATMEWRLAHKLSNIGGGYVWPNITIFSDGERTALISRPSKEKSESPFRYIADSAVVMPSSDYESEIDSFIEQVLGRLESEEVKETNLSKLWAEICAERKDPELSQIRKLEALMGRDPEEVEGSLISRLISDANILSVSGIEELVANYLHLPGQQLPSATELTNIAKKVGFCASTNNMVTLARNTEQQHSQIPAWKIGADTAQALREQEKLGDGQITNKLLAQMLAVDPKFLTQDKSSSSDVSYFLENQNDESRIVLRPKWPSGRRFELARLLGDRLMSNGKYFFPATRAYTYRQKAQRSFAAELLSPFDTLMEMLQGDYSEENLSDVAEYFQVSQLTIRTQLVNHKILEREDLELELAAA
ncbi:MAG: hypothetical protein PHI11_10695 [Gallionella sp.]|nr:hypothetical protein [Gallionella sp.]